MRPFASPLPLVLLATSALAACAPAAQAPDQQVEGFDLYWGDHPPLDGVDVALQVIWDEGRSTCPAEARDRFEWLWGGAIYWRPVPFRCSGTEAESYSGCQVHDGVFEVGWRPRVEDTALVDELGHMVFQRCHGRDGETWDGTRSHYDPEFQGWVERTRARIRTTLRR